jgi:hypothetical protein
MSNSKRIGKGKNAFSVLKSDYDSGFKGNKIEVIQNGISTMKDAHHVRKEVARIEAIKEIKPVKTKKVKINES